MASTLLNESGKWNPDAIERALAHGDSDKVRAAYHRGTHWQERVTMAQWWSDYLDAISQGAKIVPLCVKRALTTDWTAAVITIDWTLGGFDDVQEDRRHLLHLIYDWMRTKGSLTAFLWVMEDWPKFGVHSQILIHIPTARRSDFGLRFRGWQSAVSLDAMQLCLAQYVGREIVRVGSNFLRHPRGVLCNPHQ